MENGNLFLYDVHSREGPILDSITIGKHRDTIWELKWISDDANEVKYEVLISISGDGRMVQWSTRKGWEFKGTFRIVLLKRYHDL